MDLQLENKIAVVTGGSKGIGRIISLALALEKCTVVVVAREQSALDLVTQEIKSKGGRAVPFAADLCNQAEIQKLVEFVQNNWGRIDILVNNLGGIRKFSSFEALSDQEWLDIFNLNVFSTVKVTRAFLPLMQKQQKGRIINMSSEVGIQPEPHGVHYSAAKACINSITKSLAKAYGKDGILVNAVSPSFTLTQEIEGLIYKRAETMQITPDQVLANLMKGRSPYAINRPARSEEVASMVLYLASELSSFVTGANFRVDGGTVENI